MYKWGNKNWECNHLSSELAIKSQVLHTVWCHISSEAAGEIRNWLLLGVKGLMIWGKTLAWGSLHCIRHMESSACETRTLRMRLLMRFRVRSVTRPNPSPQTHRRKERVDWKGSNRVLFGATPFPIHAYVSGYVSFRCAVPQFGLGREAQGRAPRIRALHYPLINFCQIIDAIFGCSAARPGTRPG